MKRFANIVLTLLLALTLATPALGADLPPTDTLDQRLDQAVPAHTLQLGSNPSSHAASEGFTVCHGAVLLHNSNGCGLTHMGDDVFEATGGQRRANDIFGQLTKGGKQVDVPSYPGGKMIEVDGQRFGQRLNGDGLPTIDYGPSPFSDPFRIHFTG